jgi:hypothetical protein
MMPPTPNQESAKPADAAKPANVDWKIGWEALKGSAAAIAAVFSLYATYYSSRNTETLNTLKLQLESRAQQSALDIRVYELVEKALSLEGAAAKGHGVAAAALINALTLPPLRDQLLNALRVASKDEALIKELDATLQFDAQSDDGRSPSSGGAPGGSSSRLDETAPTLFSALVPQLLAQPASGLPGPLKGHRIDLFYCESQANASITEARRKRAEAAAARLRTGTNDMNVQVRKVPTLVQARPEYQSAADEIRYGDQPRELEAARFLGRIVGIRDNPRKSNVKQSANYLSVFFCGS